MIRTFKRTRPAHEPVRITPEDAQIAATFAMSPAEWADLSSLARVDHREEFYRANGLAS